MGFEPTTSGTTNRRSNQLSYDRHTNTLRRSLGTAEARFCRMSAIWEAESCGRWLRPSDASTRCLRFSSYITCWTAPPMALTQSVARSASPVGDPPGIDHDPHAEAIFDRAGALGAGFARRTGEGVRIVLNGAPAAFPSRQWSARDEPPRPCLSALHRDQNFAPSETVTVAGAAQPWKNTVGSDCVR